MRPYGFLALGAALSIMPAAAQACQVDRFEFRWGADAQTHVALRDRETCRIGFQSSSVGHVDSVAVAQPPQHGSLTPAGPTHWVYHPARGYSGPDQVVVQATGNAMHMKRVSSGETRLTYAIDVAP